MSEVIILLKEILVETRKTRALITKLIETKSTKSEKGEWVTELEVMTILNVSKSRLRDLCNDGFLAFSKVNSVKFYKRADIIQLLEKNYAKKTRTNYY